MRTLRLLFDLNFRCDQNVERDIHYALRYDTDTRVMCAKRRKRRRHFVAVPDAITMYVLNRRVFFCSLLCPLFTRFLVIAVIVVVTISSHDIEQACRDCFELNGRGSVLRAVLRKLRNGTYDEPSVYPNVWSSLHFVMSELPGTKRSKLETDAASKLRKVFPALTVERALTVVRRCDCSIERAVGVVLAEGE